MAARTEPRPALPPRVGWPEVAAALGTLAIVGLWWL